MASNIKGCTEIWQHSSHNLLLINFLQPIISHLCQCSICWVILPFPRNCDIDTDGFKVYISPKHTAVLTTADPALKMSYGEGSLQLSVAISRNSLLQMLTLGCCLYDALAFDCLSKDAAPACHSARAQSHLVPLIEAYLLVGCQSPAQMSCGIICCPETWRHLWLWRRSRACQTWRPLSGGFQNAPRVLLGDFMSRHEHQFPWNLSCLEGQKYCMSMFSQRVLFHSDFWLWFDPIVNT